LRGVRSSRRFTLGCHRGTPLGFSTIASRDTSAATSIRLCSGEIIKSVGVTLFDAVNDLAQSILEWIPKHDKTTYRSTHSELGNAFCFDIHNGNRGIHVA
jgi:hypothetical protein